MKKWKAIRDSFVKDHRTNTVNGTGQAASKKKKYVYYDQLLFLLPHVKGNQRTTSNIAPLANQEYVEDILADQAGDINTYSEEEHSLGESAHTEPVAGTSTNNNPAILKATVTKRKVNNINVAAGKRTALERSVLASTKDLTNIWASSLEMQKEEKKKEEEKNVDKFGHKAFMLSFVPVLDSIPFSESILLRGQISNIFSQYYAQKNNSGQMRSHSSNSMYNASQPTPTAYDGEQSNDFNISDYMHLH